MRNGPCRGMSYNHDPDDLIRPINMNNSRRNGHKETEFIPFRSPKSAATFEVITHGDAMTTIIPGTSIPMLFLLSSPRMPIQMAWAAQWAAVGPYLDTLLPRYAVQLTQIIGPVTGILVAPLVGVLSDRCTNKFGRRRPFILYAAIGSAICWTLMGYTVEFASFMGDAGDRHTGDRTWTALATIVFYTWMDITVNIAQTPAFLLIADFAGVRQTTGAAIGQGWSALGSIFIAAYIHWFGHAYASLKSFLGMLSIVMIVVVGIVCIFVKETPLQPRDSMNDRPPLGLIREAIDAIVKGLVTLPKQLAVYGCLMFFGLYGFTAYSGNKAQFFGLEVYGGTQDGAESCLIENESCTESQSRYRRGVEVAGGTADLLFNGVMYVYVLILPFLVQKFGGKWVITLTLIPQSLFMLMAFSTNVTFVILILVLASFTSGTLIGMMVPVIINVLGEDADIGLYVGAMNSANCFGQLLNFLIGAMLVETDMGYKLPIFVGGAVGVIGIFVSVFYFKITLFSL